MLKPISTQDKYNTQSKGNKVYWKEHCESIKYHKTENFLVLFIIMMVYIPIVTRVIHLNLMQIVFTTIVSITWLYFFKNSIPISFVNIYAIITHFQSNFNISLLQLEWVTVPIGLNLLFQAHILLYRILLPC